MKIFIDRKGMIGNGDDKAKNLYPIFYLESIHKVTAAYRVVIAAKGEIQSFQSRQRRDWMPDQVRHDGKRSL